MDNIRKARLCASMSIPEPSAFMSFMHSMQFGMMVVGLDRRVRHINDAALRMMGADTHSHAVGKVCHCNICTAEAGQCPVLDLGRKVDMSEKFLVGKDGKLIPVLKSVNMVNLDGEDVLVESFVDISRIVEMEDALRRSEGHLNSMIEAISDQMCMMDRELSIVWANGAVKAAFGDDILGRKCYEVFHERYAPCEPYPCLTLRAFRDGGVHEHCVKVLDKSGQPMHLHTKANVAFRDKSGKPETVMEISRNVTDIVVTQEKLLEREQRLEYLAHYDELTGLPNRLLFKERLEQALAAAGRDRHMPGVLLIDLDRFKTINDSLGHSVGDRLLKKVADRLYNCIREEDTFARLGGDEFTVLMGRVQGPDEISDMAGRIMNALKPPFAIGENELYITASIGGAAYPDSGGDAITLLRGADIAMYRAKEMGRNNFQMHARSADGISLERIKLENRLHKALDKGEFVVFYQPQVSLTTGSLTGMEALVRWELPDKGIVSPGEFIPLAEETGLILPLGGWVLRAACAQARKWQDAGYPPVRVSVNLSPRQFQQHDLVEMVRDALADAGLPPRFLELEITEGAIMNNVDGACITMQKLSGMGINISVDDFGIGYSSLSYLKKFPIHTLKIDRSFISNITTDPDDAAISTAVIAMAHSLKLKVVAEGVEDVEQLEFLRKLGCDEVQGYLFGRPAPAAESEKLLAQEIHRETPPAKLLRHR